MSTYELLAAPEPRMLKVPEVAERLHVCEKTVRRMLRDEELPREKIRGCTRVPTVAVEDYRSRGGDD